MKREDIINLTKSLVAELKSNPNKIEDLKKSPGKAARMAHKAVKGVHQSPSASSSQGASVAGNKYRSGAADPAIAAHKTKLKELRSMKAPNLPKSEKPAAPKGWGKEDIRAGSMNRKQSVEIKAFTKPKPKSEMQKGDAVKVSSLPQAKEPGKRYREHSLQGNFVRRGQIERAKGAASASVLKERGISAPNLPKSEMQKSKPDLGALGTSVEKLKAMRATAPAGPKGTQGGLLQSAVRKLQNNKKLAEIGARTRAATAAPVATGPVAKPEGHKPRKFVGVGISPPRPFGKVELKKDNKPHRPNSPQDKAHDVVEENQSLTSALNEFGPKGDKRLLNHLRTLNAAAKLRSPKNEAMGREVLKKPLQKLAENPGEGRGSLVEVYNHHAPDEIKHFNENGSPKNHIAHHWAAIADHISGRAPLSQDSLHAVLATHGNDEIEHYEENGRPANHIGAHWANVAKLFGGK